MSRLLGGRRASFAASVPPWISCNFYVLDPYQDKKKKKKESCFCRLLWSSCCDLNVMMQTPSPPIVAGSSSGRKSSTRIIIVTHGLPQDDVQVRTLQFSTIELTFQWLYTIPASVLEYKELSIISYKTWVPILSNNQLHLIYLAYCCLVFKHILWKCNLLRWKHWW